MFIVLDFPEDVKWHEQIFLEEVYLYPGIRFLFKIVEICIWKLMECRCALLEQNDSVDFFNILIDELLLPAAADSLILP